MAPVGKGQDKLRSGDFICPNTLIVGLEPSGCGLF